METIQEQTIVFLKAPRPGQVKTRLAAAIGNDEACAAYRELVETLFRNIQTMKAVQLRFSPDDAGADVAPWLRTGWTALPQGEGDLGRRLARAMGEAFSSGAEKVVVIGSDCPDVSARDIRTAFRELKEHDVVVGPALDGGYWLIGLRAPRPELFEGIEWSTDRVLGETLQRVKQGGLRVQLLRILSDVDTAEDWERQRGRD